MIPRHRPLLADWDWQRYAVCRGMESSVFFSPHGEQGVDRRARERTAKAVCMGCPVLQPCAWTAMSGPEYYGVWGGMSEAERRRLQRFRARGSVAGGSASPESG